MMTNITIVSTFTAIPEEGKVELGNVEIGNLKISDMKKLIQRKTEIPSKEQLLWWRGYLLDREDSTIMDSCVGVNAGEKLQPGASSLVLFLTVPLIPRQSNFEN